MSHAQYRTKQSQFILVALTKYLIQIMIYRNCVDPGDEASPTGARATWPPLHHGDLEEGRPHKIISSKTEKIRVKRHQIWQEYRYKEKVKQRRRINTLLAYWPKTLFEVRSGADCGQTALHQCTSWLCHLIFTEQHQDLQDIMCWKDPVKTSVFPRLFLLWTHVRSYLIKL